jgi:bacillithiol biosynthesis cysteine-adding enzyme BshC
MRCRSISYTHLPHQSKLFIDYLENFSRVASFYSCAPKLAGAARIARSLKFPSERRTAVAAILREQNAAFGMGSPAEKNLERFEKGAVAVVTGQQVGLFSGPAYSLYKALTAVTIAGELSRGGIAAVPVFWLATEDHDLDEVRSAHWLTRGQVVPLGLEAGAAGGRPVGRIALGPEVAELVRRAASALEGPGAQSIASDLEACYRPTATYGSAFAKLFARLFEQDGLILLDPLDVRFHRMAAPLYRRAVEDSGVLREKLIARKRELDREGYSAQVRVTARSTLLFSLETGLRQAITESGGKFQAGEKSYSRPELTQLAADAPEKLSASALLRPALQDFLLPSAAYIGGAAEIAYYAQAAAVHEHLVGRMPAVLPRADFTLVDSKAAKLLEQYALAPEDLWAGRQEVRRRMELRFVPATLARDFGRSAKELERALERLRGPIRKLDSTLEGALDRARRAAAFHLAKLQRKAGRSRELRENVLAAHEEYLHGLLYPKKQIQSRVLCALPFLARWGMDLLRELKRFSGSKNLAAHHIIRVE